MKYTEVILQTLKEAPARRIKLLEDLGDKDLWPTDSVLLVTLSNMKKKGLILATEHHPCKECGYGRRQLYSITEKGLVHLKNYFLQEID